MEQHGRIFLTAGDASLGRHGNYGDTRGSNYSWDSTVANSSLPAIGDLICVKSKQEVLGVSLISNLVNEKSWKTRLRCVNCTSTKLTWRSKQGNFRCIKCKEIQSRPDVEFMDSLQATHAFYDWFFTPTPSITLREIQSVSKTPKSIQSIQTLEVHDFLNLLPREALWRLGYMRLAGRIVRRENISLGRVVSKNEDDKGTCDFTGLAGNGRLVNFDFVTYSTTNQNFVVNGSAKIIDILGEQMHSGGCVIDLQTNSIKISGFGQNPDQLYPIMTQSAIITSWLQSYTGLFDD